ncbi:FCGBP protein, partial [Aegotheles bennettii]|nr:FCGBP protein [Aegotheles bennettii]
MCGNNNGDPQDDLLIPDGNVAQDVVELGRSWKVADESHSCQDDCGEDCGQCQRVQEAKYKVETSCGLLTQRQGPFERCHATIDPGVYLKNCVYDLCTSDGRQAKLCQALEAYADDCQEEGVTISDWRTPARCPLTCPKNSTYSPCGTSCPTTCNAAAVPGDCAASACVETCECQEGFALDANECVPKDNCGCVFQGLLHGPGEEFWGDLTCTKRCSCHPVSKRTMCHRRQCRSGEECGVQEGLQSCHPKSYATCSAVGATHYETFDGGKFIFQGTCIYQLAALCRKNLGLVDFLVLVQNGHHENDDVLSPIALVIVKVYDKTIVINQKHPGKVTIDNQLVNLPYHPSDRKISIYRGGLEAVVETDFGLTVTYDWQSQVTVTVPSTYGNALCGLCGNYNGNAGDEMKMRSGRVTSNPDTFGRSWKVADVSGCVERSKVKCSPGEATQQKALNLGCEIILEEHGPLGACRAHLDATTYFQNCVHDVCLFPDREDVICSIVARYAAACQAAGVTIGRWRRNDFCNVLCPSNSHYEVCSRGCSRTCSNLYAPAKCSGRCREGCACDDGFVLSGDECVPESKCGCVHQDFYYKAEETFYPTNKEQCRCRAGNAVNCQETSCPGDSEGEVIDGVFQCPSVTPATCTVTGDHSYMSFDGMALNISGTCSYVLAQTCTGDEVQPFAVKMEKDARQKEKVSGIHALSIEVYGLTLTLTREKRGDVMVNSITHHLPAVLSEGRIQVQRHGMGVILHTNFGLVVRYDLLHHVTITIQPNYQNHLCGLCGNYNGQRDDDLLLPSGQKAPNVVAFSSAWRTSDVPCSEDCSKDDCPVCTENKKKALQEPSYCGILVVPNGPFHSCHRFIDPTFYFQACLHDLCLTKGDPHVHCRSIQSYATACQDAGVVLEAWRRPSFCFLKCPANSTYSLCTNHCRESCRSLRDASSCPQTCVEGCQCDQGFVFDGSGCVPEDGCGCFVEGKYYKPNEEVLTQNCRLRCKCVPGQGVACESHSCTKDETCEIQDGVLGC